MFPVPVCELLKGAPGLQHRGIISGARNELQSDREFFVREATRDGERRKAADIADSTKWVREGQSLGDIHN